MSVIIIQDKEKDYRINYSIAVFLLKQNSVFDKVDGIFRSKYHTEHRQQSSLKRNKKRKVIIVNDFMNVSKVTNS